MPLNQTNPLELPLYQFSSLLAQNGLKHGISTRHSPNKPLFPEAAQPHEWRISGPGKSVPWPVLRQRRIEMLAALDTDHHALFPNLTSPMQRHTANVAIVGTEVLGAERTWVNSIPDTDALVTNLPNLPLLTAHADCPPVLLFDPVQRVIASVHSGWRGTVAGIVGATVQAMVTTFDCQPANILAGIGPAIGVCCYQVGEPVLSAVADYFGEETAAKLLPLQPDGSHHFDLWQALTITLLNSGLAPQNIELSGICTRCNSDTFFSYRATPPEQRRDYGNFGALIVMPE